MTYAFLALLAGLALADSLNPFTIAAQAYLLATPRPFARSLAFLLGTAATYFAGGMLLLSGWSAAREAIMPLVPSWGWSAAQVALGLALCGFAWWSWWRATVGKPLAPPSSLSVPATLAFAFASTLSDLPTALPLFVATDRIAAQNLVRSTEFALIVFYTLIYVLPLVALVAIRAAFAQRSDRLFAALLSAVNWVFRVLLPPTAGLAAVYLLAEGGFCLVTRP